MYLGTEKGTGTKGPKQQVIFMRSIAHDAAVLTTSEGAVASLAKSLDQLDRYTNISIGMFMVVAEYLVLLLLLLGLSMK